MSSETSEWLNQNVLIGYTDHRGKAWHYRASDQGAEPNHYPGAIPTDDVLRRLFFWHAQKVDLRYDFNGQEKQSVKKAVIRDDTGAELGSFKDGYQPHQFDEWLIHNVSTLLDTSSDDLGIGSAGLLKGGAVAWAEISVPETITTPEGVAFRPNLLACTSFNGSLATTYKRTVQATVCDNTLGVALSEKGQTVKIKHSRNSLDKIADVRETLAIVHTVADDFARQVAELTSQKITDDQFEQIVDHFDPLPKPGESKTTRAITLAEKKRDTLWRLWVNDERVNPWRNTAFGVTQAYNTYAHHESNVRGMSRPERNMLKAIDGTTEKADAEVLEKILELSA